MAGGVITTGNHPKALWPGVHAFWGQVYNEHGEEYTDLYDVETSEKAFEEDVPITGFGLAQHKEEGGPIAYDSEFQGAVQRYYHLAYALGYKVTHEELKDNLYEVVAMRRAKANAFSIRQTIENLGAAPYNDAFTGSIFTFATGTTFISANQINTTGGTFSNRLTPDAALSEASLEDIMIMLMGAQNDRGLQINLQGRSLHVHRNEWFNANRILKSVLQSDSSSNNINVLKATNALPGGIKMNHYFTLPRAWFVRTNVPQGPTWFWRERPDFSQDNDFDTKNAKAATYFRASAGATDPRGVFGSAPP
jgi:hypothetical protein